MLTNIRKDFPDSSVGKESACNAGDPGSIPVWRRATREGIGYLLQYSLASLVAQLVKNACNARDLGSIAGLGRSPGKGKGYPLQYSGLENSMDCIVHGVTELHMTERLSLSLVLVNRTWYSLNFMLRPKEEAPRLSYRLARRWEMVGLGCCQESNIKDGVWLFSKTHLSEPSLSLLS